MLMDEIEVGVGPWPGGQQNWPLDDAGNLPDFYDTELLTQGDRRNVVDAYRYWKMEAIIADLGRHRHGFHIAIENWGHDFNIGSVVRSANAFGVNQVHIVGRRRWNRRGAMVTDRYLQVNHFSEVADFANWAESQGLPIIGIDNIPGSKPIEKTELPEKCVLLFGEESQGLTAQAQEISETILHITQFGSTRSINAGAAAAIAMHRWVCEHASIN